MLLAGCLGPSTADWEAVPERLCEFLHGRNDREKQPVGRFNQQQRDSSWMYSEPPVEICSKATERHFFTVNPPAHLMTAITNRAHVDLRLV